MSDIDSLVNRIGTQMDLDRETEQAVLAEIRDHLEEAAADARAGGLDDQQALAQAAARFGVEQKVANGLHSAHAGWGTADAVIAAGLPVICGLRPRWDSIGLAAPHEPPHPLARRPGRAVDPASQV